MESLLQKAKEKGITVSFKEKPMENRELSYWYGGEVASLTKGNVTLLLDANGDVCCTHRSGTEDDSNEEFEIFMKDKNKEGKFKKEFDEVIKDDQQIIQLLQNYYDEKLPHLEIENNNWWEVFVIKDGVWHDLMSIIEVCYYTEALELLIDEFDEYASMVD